jgi:hypothetical protein
MKGSDRETVTERHAICDVMSGVMNAGDSAIPAGRSAIRPISFLPIELNWF